MGPKKGGDKKGGAESSSGADKKGGEKKEAKGGTSVSVRIQFKSNTLRVILESKKSDSIFLLKRLGTFYARSLVNAWRH